MTPTDKFIAECEKTTEEVRLWAEMRERQAAHAREMFWFGVAVGVIYTIIGWRLWLLLEMFWGRL